MLFYGHPVSSDSSSSSSSSEGSSKEESSSGILPADNGVENIGLAVFKGDKLVGKLSKTETLSNLIITDKLKSCRLSIPDPDDQSKAIDFYLTADSGRKIDVSILNGTPYIKFQVKMNGRISSINQISEHISEERINKIEEAVSHYLKIHLLNYLYKTSKEYKSDISGIGKYVIKKFKTRSELAKYNWLDNYENSFFDVDAEVKVRSSFLLTGT